MQIYVQSQDKGADSYNDPHVAPRRFPEAVHSFINLAYVPGKKSYAIYSDRRALPNIYIKMFIYVYIYIYVSLPLFIYRISVSADIHKSTSISRIYNLYQVSCVYIYAFICFCWLLYATTLFKSEQEVRPEDRLRSGAGRRGGFESPAGAGSLLRVWRSHTFTNQSPFVCGASLRVSKKQGAPKKTLTYYDPLYKDF